MEKITSFRDQYRFLSNFHQNPVTLDGLTYPNGEAAFQAQKCGNDEDKLKYTTTRNPVRAKQMGKKEHIDIAAWNARSYDVMLAVVRAKFADPVLAQMLLDTGDAIIEEGNTWHDNIWGRCTCERCAAKPSRNQLGRILMLVRDELRAASDADA